MAISKATGVPLLMVNGFNFIAIFLTNCKSIHFLICFLNLFTSIDKLKIVMRLSNMYYFCLLCASSHTGGGMRAQEPSWFHN